MNQPYTGFCSKNTYVQLGTLYPAWQPSSNAIKSGQARKTSATLATFQTALFVAQPIWDLNFWPVATQDCLQSTDHADRCLGHLLWQRVCPSVPALSLPHSITCIFQQICKIFPSSKLETCFWPIVYQNFKISKLLKCPHFLNLLLFEWLCYTALSKTLRFTFSPCV